MFYTHTFNSVLTFLLIKLFILLLLPRVAGYKVRRSKNVLAIVFLILEINTENFSSETYARQPHNYCYVRTTSITSPIIDIDLRKRYFIQLIL